MAIYLDWWGKGKAKREMMSISKLLKKSNSYHPQIGEAYNCRLGTCSFRARHTYRKVQGDRGKHYRRVNNMQ